MVSSPRTKAVLAVVAGVVVIVGWLVWSWSRGAYVAAPTATTTASRAATTGSVDPETGLPWVDAAELPSQARHVLTLIDTGGPYPYSQDGQTFQNAERLLPIKAKGFYTEYTVKLPSSSDRGPLRIIMGGRGQWYFWTADHYASFARIRR